MTPSWSCRSCARRRTMPSQSRQLASSSGQLLSSFLPSLFFSVFSSLFVCFSVSPFFFFFLITCRNHHRRSVVIITADRRWWWALLWNISRSLSQTQTHTHSVIAFVILHINTHTHTHLLCAHFLSLLLLLRLLKQCISLHYFAFSPLTQLYIFPFFLPFCTFYIFLNVVYNNIIKSRVPIREANCFAREASRRSELASS